MLEKKEENCSADEQDIEYIVVRFLKEIAVDNGGHNAHRDHIRREGQVRAAKAEGCRAGEKTTAV